MAEHLSCQEVVELVTGYLEHTLDPHTHGLFEEHINFCDGCETYLDQMRDTIAVVGRSSKRPKTEQRAGAPTTDTS